MPSSYSKVDATRDENRAFFFKHSFIKSLFRSRFLTLWWVRGFKLNMNENTVIRFKNRSYIRIKYDFVLNIYGLTSLVAWNQWDISSFTQRGLHKCTYKRERQQPGFYLRAARFDVNIRLFIQILCIPQPACANCLSFDNNSYELT